MELVFEDEFEGDALDDSKWLPYYLPHWSSRARAAARYSVGGGLLRLRVEPDQEPWCPEWDGEVRVSSLQTGVRSGQHRFHPDAVVREEQAEERLYTPRYGRIEIRMRAIEDPDAMVALWMIGFEDEPERSAEICVAEIFGSEVEADRALVGMGVHPFGDPSIADDFEKVPLTIDAREFHVYAADWMRERITFEVDREPVKVVEQSPDYPMQLMLGVYDFGVRRRGLEFAVDYVRGWRL